MSETTHLICAHCGADTAVSNSAPQGSVLAILRGSLIFHCSSCGARYPLLPEGYPGDQTKLSELSYPQRLVVDMLHYSTWLCEKTKDMKCSEIIGALGVFFTDEQLSDARGVLAGRIDKMTPKT